MVDGVKAVQNPRMPLYGELKFDLVKELSIGGETDENYMFYAVGDIEVDQAGNIFVLEKGNQRIQVYNSDGVHLRTIGKKGQGPGEFTLPADLALDDKNGCLAAADILARKIVLFDLDGNYLDRDIPLEDAPEKIALDSAGGVIGVFSEQLVDRRKFIRRVNREGAAEKTFLEVKSPIQKISTSAKSSFFFNVPFEKDLYLTRPKENLFVCGSSEEYRLIFVNAKGGIMLESMKDEPPRRVPREEKDKILSQIRAKLMPQGVFVSSDAIDFPEYLPFVHGLLSDDEGRIYVQRTSKAEAAEGGYVFDVFDREGIFIHKVQTDHYPYLIEAGCLYTVIVDDEAGTESVVRFRIKNWDVIK